jgi:DNA-binding Lrp family transcriptional regulator
MELGEKDQQLIGLLRENGRLSVSEIARKMAVSRTAAQMRLQKLERNGVIDGYSLRLSPTYLKNRVRALVMIKFPPGRRAEIEAALAEIPQLTSLYSISGKFDMSAVISAPSMGELDTTIDKIGCLEGIDETMSSIILSTKIDR